MADDDAVIALANRITVMAAAKGVHADILVSACCLVLADLITQAHANHGQPTTELLAAIIRSILDDVEMLREAKAEATAEEVRH